ncbi:MAG: acetolactate synthase small subunit [Lachnospiraceae bacterium]|nr:acetolactate synthase small subunit [Lachnospiraceae bacterium]
MKQYTIAVLVNNQFGVLNRVTSMFRRRQFNIIALSVSETESIEYSRITVTFEGEEISKQQLVNQLYKLPDVDSIKDFSDQTSLSYDLLLIKMKNEPDTREDIRAAAQAFSAETVDYAKDSMVFRLTDSPRRIDDFINLMRDYTILEICRSGSISLEKGSNTIKQMNNI